MGFLYVGQVGLEFPTSGDPPALGRSESTGIIGVNRHIQTHMIIEHLKFLILFNLNLYLNS